MNQAGGFDCPGCAWPDPRERAATEFCESGAKALAHEATRARLSAEFFARWSIPALLEQSDHWLEQQGRLVEPLHRAPGADHYAPVSWDEAFAGIARALACAARSERGDLLHLGPHQQRGGVPVSALRALVRHQQPAGLLEPVSRVERRRAHARDRRGQGHGEPRGLRARRRDLRDRAEPGLEPPAHAHRAPGRQAPRRADRRDQPAARARARALHPSRRSRSRGWAAAPRSRTSTSRCAWAATSRCCRGIAKARARGGGAPSRARARLAVPVLAHDRIRDVSRGDRRARLGVARGGERNRARRRCARPRPSTCAPRA